MAGQQALHQFLNTPSASPGKASSTGILTPAVGQKPTPRQAQALKQNRQAQQDAQKQQALGQRQQALGQRQQSLDQRQQELDQRQQQRQSGAISGALGDLKESGQNVTQRVSDWADRLPTPGGIGLLLLAIFILLWAVVPVNRSDGGLHTRLELLWLTLTGRTKMSAKPEGGVGGGALGGGEMPAMNGYHPTPIESLMANLPIRDWGQNV